MNDRIKNDWKDVERLEKLQQEYKNLKDKSLKTQMKAQVTEMEKNYQQWIDLRLKGIVRQYGGIFDDYALIPVETDDIISAMTAKYITYDGKKFYYEMAPRWEIDKDNPGQINVLAPQWVRGNHALLENDYTNFREEDFSEDVYFSLEFWQNEGTQDIVVEVFTWYPFEDRADNPKGKRFCSVICQGVYHHKPKIIEVR